MTQLRRIRNQQILREAEGYLELISVFADRWAPTPAVRDRIAQSVLRCLDRLDPRDSDRAHALYLSGEALRAMEQYREAVTPLSKAADLDPDNVHIWLSLAWCQKRCGRLDLAIQAMEEALAADSSEAIVYYNLACYWSLASNLKRAVHYLSRAFEIDANFRDLVADEADFDPIRSHPEFQALTTVIV